MLGQSWHHCPITCMCVVGESLCLFSKVNGRKFAVAISCTWIILPPTPALPYPHFCCSPSRKWLVLSVLMGPHQSSTFAQCRHRCIHTIGPEATMAFQLAVAQSHPSHDCPGTDVEKGLGSAYYPASYFLKISFNSRYLLQPFLSPNCMPLRNSNQPCLEAITMVWVCFSIYEKASIDSGSRFVCYFCITFIDCKRSLRVRVLLPKNFLQVGCSIVLL